MNIIIAYHKIFYGLREFGNLGNENIKPVVPSKSIKTKERFPIYIGVHHIAHMKCAS